MAKGDKDFYFETLCKYKNNDGSIGVILQVKEKKNEKIQGYVHLSTKIIDCLLESTTPARRRPEVLHGYAAVHSH